MECLTGSLNVLSDQEIQVIHNGSLQLLAEMGMELPVDYVLEQLQSKGHRVDMDKKIVFFEADAIQKAIKTAPETYRWHARNPEKDLVIGDHTVNYGIASMISTIVDPDSGKRRFSKIEDTYNVSRVSSSLDLMCDAFGAVWPGDAPEGCEHTYIMHAQFSQNDKPARARLHGKTQGKDAIAMAQIVAGGEKALKDKPMLMGLYSPMSPLSNTAEQFEGALELIKNGQLLVICPGLYGGAIAPVTIAGLLTQQNAEFLGMLTIAQAINPGTPIAYGNFSSVLDMRTGAGPMSTPEACLISSAVAQLGRHYKVPRRGHGGTDSNTDDIQSGLETASKLLSGSLAGLNIISHSAGFIDGGRAFSYAHLIADHETVAYVDRIIKGIRVNSEAIAIDEIKKAGHKGSFIASPHTAKFMRSEMLFTELSNRKAFDAWQAEGAKTVGQKGLEKARTLLAEVQAPPLDQAIDRELREYMKSVEKFKN
jgi:trimethylamine---corrinoid protein Co-methyltransferase